MRLTPEHTQMLMSAFSAVTSVAATQAHVEHGRTTLRAVDARFAHEREMFGLKTDIIRSMLHALVERRTDVVQTGAKETLAFYAEQSRHYQQQQNLLAEKLATVTDPLERANITQRLTETDIQLKRLCRDAANLNREMNRVILLLGGSMPVLSPDVQQALMFNPRN